MEAGERRSADRASAVVREGRRRESEQAGTALRRHRPRLLLLERRRRALDRDLRGAAESAGELGRRPETVPRRRRVDLRARHLRARRHHAARAGDAAGDRRRDASVFAAAGVQVDRARARVRRLQREERAARRRRAAGPRRRRQGGPRSEADCARGAQPRRVGSSLRSAASHRHEDDAGREPAHLGRAQVPREGHAAGDALGPRAGAGRADRRAGEVHGEADGRRPVGDPVDRDPPRSQGRHVGRRSRSLGETAAAAARRHLRRRRKRTARIAPGRRS